MRRARVRAGAAVLLLALAPVSSRPHEARAALRRPNLVLILTDDLNARLMPHLPYLRAMLAENGTSFDMTVPTAVCAPSRASLLTGRYAHNHGVTSNGLRSGARAFRRNGNEERTFAVWLDAAGYATGFFGKYLNGYDPKSYWVPPGWDRWLSVTRTSLSRGDFQVVDERGVQHDVRGAYDVDWFAEAAADFVATAPTPFLAVWAPMSPHSPFEAAERHRGALDERLFDWPPSFRADADDLARLTRTRLEMMLAVEEGVERLLRVLEARGLLTDTYVVFTSDNGFFMGEHGFRGGKGELFEEATQVPLYVRGPGVPVARSDALVAVQDLAVTFADLAGASPRDEVDGRSLVPLLEGGEWSPRRRVLLEYWSGGDEPRARGLRLTRGKIVELADGACLATALDTDPYELAPAPCRGPAADEQRALLASLARCSGARCRALEERVAPDP